MATPAYDIPRFVLPVRIRSKPSQPALTAPEAELAKRVAELPGVQIIGSDAHHAATACIHLAGRETAFRNPSPPVLFCRFGSTGISVEGLTDAERYQVLSRGWGRLEHHRIRLFTPRDEGDLEACWSILLRAYNTITRAPAGLHVAPQVLPDNLPKPSRTSLV